MLEHNEAADVLMFHLCEHDSVKDKHMTTLSRDKQHCGSVE